MLFSQLKAPHVNRLFERRQEKRWWLMGISRLAWRIFSVLQCGTAYRFILFKPQVCSVVEKQQKASAWKKTNPPPPPVLHYIQKIAKRQFGGTLYCSCSWQPPWSQNRTLTNTVSPYLFLKAALPRSKQSHWNVPRRRRARLPFQEHMDSRCFSFLYFPSQQVNINKTKAPIIRCNILLQGWKAPGCGFCCNHRQLWGNDYY